MPNDFISREAAIELCSNAQGKAGSKAELAGISKIWHGLKRLPAADVAEVVHARWIETPKDGWTRMECSGCGHSYYVPANINPIEWADDRNYCVKCGSRMDGGEHHA